MIVSDLRSFAQVRLWGFTPTTQTAEEKHHDHTHPAQLR